MTCGLFNLGVDLWCEVSSEHLEGSSFGVASLLKATYPVAGNGVNPQMQR